MSIATEITRIQQAKADIKTAIEAKGVTVPSSATIDTYDDYVSQISGGGGSPTPSSLTSWDYDSYGRVTNIVIKNGVTTIPDSYQTGNKVLTSCTIPSSVTTIGQSAFYNVGDTKTPFDVSNINLTNVSASTGFSYVFGNCYLKGNITIPNSLLSGSTSGVSTTCYQLFNTSRVPENKELTINVYADGRIIPKNMFSFNNGNTINKGKLSIIVHGTPTFLSSAAFSCSSGRGIDQSVTFADCTAPPNAPSYGTGSTSSFYNFRGTIYVPSDGLTAWKNKYTGMTSHIQAIPNS